MDKLFSLGPRLRNLRKERNLSQRELARQAGISANAISLIERNEISSSVATLHCLATALNVKISYFLEDDDGQTEIMHVKASERPSLSSKGLAVAGLGKRLRGQDVEPFFITLARGSESGRRPVIHAGHEIVCCLQGAVEYDIDGQVYLLEAGNSCCSRRSCHITGGIHKHQRRNFCLPVMAVDVPSSQPRHPAS